MPRSQVIFETLFGFIEKDFGFRRASIKESTIDLEFPFLKAVAVILVNPMPSIRPDLLLNCMLITESLCPFLYRFG